VIAFGGFLFFLGIVLLTVAFMLLLNVVEIETVLQSNIIKGALILIGILDAVAGFLLLVLKPPY
jgi:uncharacterized MnhB-related membrane protein